MHELAFPLLVGLIAIALAFDYLNGLHDAANSIATVVATHSVVALASGVARVLLTPIVVLVVAETLLGGRRSYRGGLTLLPLVLVGTLAHLLVMLKLPSLPGLWPDVVGAVGAAGYALWIRPAVPPEPETKPEEKRS